MFLCANCKSTKQCVEPESTRARILGISRDKRETYGIREFGSKRVDALRRASLGALPESTQLTSCVEGWELLTLFLTRRSISTWSQRRCGVSSCKAPELAYRSRRLPVVRQGLLGSREVKIFHCTCFFSECGSGTSTRVCSHGHKR